MPKKCSVPGCTNDIFGKGYCRYHQHLRTDTKKTTKPQKRIKPISDRRKVQVAQYHDLKGEMIAEAKEKGPIRCFVCHRNISSIYIPDIHHLDGRTEDNLTNRENLVFVHRQCHGFIHDLSYDILKTLNWYEDYLLRLKSVNIVFYEREYEKRFKTAIPQRRG